MRWLSVVTISLRVDPWEQVERWGSREKAKTPCPRWWHWQSAGEPGSPARSGRQPEPTHRVQGPQGPGG
ncbi:Hypothetical protein RADP37_04207b [Roseomonas mucosa]|uniref:Uncharacterized protein n=1 Tax=Roseomonas mucosa TaxID=207340 RepID=A0A4Y1MVR0_9PROT|nr:Hypothetical protein RADP37_04207b [Roseomonas mucosa]